MLLYENLTPDVTLAKIKEPTLSLNQPRGALLQIGDCKKHL